jgi:hypothetical protein
MSTSFSEKIFRTCRRDKKFDVGQCASKLPGTGFFKSTVVLGRVPAHFSHPNFQPARALMVKTVRWRATE